MGERSQLEQMLTWLTGAHAEEAALHRTFKAEVCIDCRSTANASILFFPMIQFIVIVFIVSFLAFISPNIRLIIIVFIVMFPVIKFP